MAKKQSDPVASVATTHAIYREFIEDWKLLAHVREGIGGFKDGTYLVAHPREWEDYTAEAPSKPTKKLKARRALACYENFGATILEAFKSSLFREVPSRTCGDEKDTAAEPSEVELWWQNVDGGGMAIDDYMSYAWDIGGTFGHLVIFMDRPKGPAGVTVADTPAPFLRAYPPQDVIDWITDDLGQLTRVLFQEPVPRSDFSQQADTGAVRFREVNREYWALYDRNGTRIEGGPVDGRHQMGTLPIVVLYARRRPLFKHVGLSVLGDPRMYKDLYNLTSEIRELLRNQTFSFINIPLGTGDGAMSVDQASAMLGGQIGAMNVIFSGQAGKILAGDAENVVVYHKEFDRRLRTIYRLAGIAWESDSKDAEAMGSLKLKREDLNTRLAAFADELEKADYTIAKLFYAAKYGADQGAKRYEAEKIRIRYPDNFDTTPFDVVLEQAQAATALGYPSLVLKELRKALLPKFLPDLEAETLKELEDAIDAAEDDTALANVRGKLTELIKGGGGKDGVVPPADAKGAAA